MNAGHYMRHARRALGARLGLTVVCVSIIALGVGASTAVASAVYALLMRPLPLPHGERLVTGFALREGFDPFGTSLLEYEAFGARASVFERIGLARRQPATLRVGTDSIRVQAATITGSYLATTGVTPALGRTIGPEDDRPGAPAVVAIGHGLWVRQLAARADAIGTTLLVDGTPATVVGVMPAAFDLPNGAELWMPMRSVSSALTLEQRLQSAYTFLGRLRADVTIERANADVLAIARGLAEEYPAQRRGWTFRVLDLRQYLIGDVDGRTSTAIAILVAAVALLMALCYVNVASLLLLYAADRLTLPIARYGTHQSRAEATNALLAAVGSLPGVSAAGITTNIPLQRMSFDSSFTVEGRAPTTPNDVPITAHRVVTPGYLQLLGVRLVSGRFLNESDTRDAPRVVVITQQLATQAWPGQNPIGRRIRRGRAGDTRPWLTVVGVVEDVKEDRFNFRIDRAGWYMPYAQEDNPAPINLVVRSSIDTGTLTRAVRERVRALDADIAVVDLAPMTTHAAEVLLTERFAAMLLTVLAAARLLLATLGLYGAISHIVLSKRSEMALRIAVGAPRTHVVGMVVREVAVVAVAGIVAGGVGAAAVSRGLSTILYGVAPHDGLTYTAAALLVAIVCMLTAWAPAARAASVDPASLLR